MLMKNISRNTEWLLLTLSLIFEPTKLHLSNALVQHAYEL